MESYCVLRDNAELKEIVKAQIKNLGLTHLELADKLGISVKHLDSYFQDGMKTRLSQMKTLHMLYLLGINVELKIELFTPPAS